MRAWGIPHARYYRCPVHRQLAIASAEGAGVEMPVSEQLARGVLSLTMHPYLSEDAQTEIIAAVKDAAESARAA